MAKTGIFLVRHGETEYNRLNKIQGRGIDEPLNETGRRQSAAIADFLRNYKLDKIYSSSLIRSIETAQIVSSRVGLDTRAYPELDEIDFGSIEGKYFEKISKEIETLHYNWRNGNVDFTLDGGESPVNAYQRADYRIKEILKDNSGSNLVFILHGRLIRILISSWLGYGLDNMHQIKHQNGSINHLLWDGSKFEPQVLNHTSHLDCMLTDDGN